MSKTANTNYGVKAITGDKKWKGPGTSHKSAGPLCFTWSRPLWIKGKTPALVDKHWYRTAIPLLLFPISAQFTS